LWLPSACLWPASGLPLQIGALTNLAALRLHHPFFSGRGGFEQLLCLPRLEQLTFDGAVGGLPAGLSTLTRLRSLCIGDGDNVDSWDEDDTEIIEQAMPHLGQLTSLELSFWSQRRAYPNPACLYGLVQLRILYWDCQVVPSGGALPAGPYLRNLQTMAAHPHVLAGSLPLLRAAQRLRHLAVLNPWDHRLANAQPLLDIVAWAASHPSLQQLLLHPNMLLEGKHETPQDWVPQVWAAAREAERQRPALCITAAYAYGTLFEDMHIP